MGLQGDPHTLPRPLEGFDALYRRDAAAALELAREHAWLMASEIRALGIDLMLPAFGAIRRDLQLPPDSTAVAGVWFRRRRG